MLREPHTLETTNKLEEPTALQISDFEAWELTLNPMVVEAWAIDELTIKKTMDDN